MKEKNRENHPKKRRTQEYVYTIRSCLCSAIIGCWDLRDKTLDYNLLRRLFAQWREAAPEYYGDYHPLTPHSITTDSWIAWQFNRPELGRGILQAYRRQDCVYESARFNLVGPEAKKSTKSATWILTMQTSYRAGNSWIMDCSSTFRFDRDPPGLY